MGGLGQLRIGGKLSLGFGLLCLVLVSVAGIAAVKSSRVDQAVDRIVSLRMPAAEASMTIELRLYASLAALRGYLLTGKDQFKQDRAEAWVSIAEVSGEMDRPARQFTNARNSELWSTARPLLSELRAAQDQAEQAGPGEAGVKILSEEAVPRVRRLVTAFEGELGAEGKRAGGLVDNQRRMLAAAVADASAQTQVMKVSAWSGLAIGLTLVAVIVVLTRRRIVRGAGCLVQSRRSGSVAGWPDPWVPARCASGEKAEQMIRRLIFAIGFCWGRPVRRRRRSERSGLAGAGVAGPATLIPLDLG